MPDRGEQPTSSVALVGYGMSAGRLHAPLLRSVPGLEIGAVVARSPERRAQAAKELPGARIVAAVEELAGLPRVPDIAIVTTPDSTHFDVTSAVLAAGIGAVVEKPLAPSFAEARILAEEAQRRGLMLTGFLNRRWDSDFLTLRQVLGSGRLGSITRFESSLTRWVTGPAFGWRGEPIPHGIDGTVGGFGSHLVDQAVTLFGPVSSVYAEIDTRRASSHVNDDVFLALEHAGGVRSHLTMGMVRTTEGPRFRLQGLAGSFEKRGFDRQQSNLVSGGGPADEDYGVEPEEDRGTELIDGVPTRVPTLRGDWRRFYVLLEDSLRTGAPLPISLDDVLHGIAVLEAAIASSTERQVKTLDR